MKYIDFYAEKRLVLTIRRLSKVVLFVWKILS